MRVAILKSKVDDNFTKGECYSCPFGIETYTDDYEDDYDFHIRDDYEDDYDFHIRCPVMAEYLDCPIEFEDIKE